MVWLTTLVQKGKQHNRRIGLQRKKTMKKQNDYFKKIEKGTLEDAVEQIWNADSKEEQLDEKQNLELTTLDFDKMSDFKKARNYLEKQGAAPPGYGGGGGAQYDFDRDMYGDSLTIHNIDEIERSRKHPQGLLKMKTKSCLLYTSPSPRDS